VENLLPLKKLRYTIILWQPNFALRVDSFLKWFSILSWYVDILAVLPCDYCILDFLLKKVNNTLLICSSTIVVCSYSSLQLYD